MKFFLYKLLFVFLILIFEIRLFTISSHGKLNNKASIQTVSKLIVNEEPTTVQKFKFLFMLKWPSVRGDTKHPLNILSYKNVLLSTSQVVFFVSQSPLNSVSRN
jgi:hypothetical protein